MTEGTTARPGGAAGAERPTDAVEQARRWLLERGLEVPDDEPAAGDPGAGDPGVGSGGSLPETTRSRTFGAGTRSRFPTEATPVDLGPAEEEAIGDFGLSGEDPVTGSWTPPLAADPNADPVAVARTIVLRKLAAQSRTRAELSKALRAKDVPQDAAEAVLNRMEEVGLVDDAGFARDWVESRQLRRHLSRSALRRELMTKGVAREEIDVALEQVDGDDELEAARSLVDGKARLMAGLDRQVRYRRLAAMLGRRGFSPGVISQVVGAVVDRGDD